MPIKYIKLIKIHFFTEILQKVYKGTNSKNKFYQFYIQTHQFHHHINSNTRHSNTIIFSHALSYSSSHPEETVFLIFITINNLIYSLIFLINRVREYILLFSLTSLLIISLRFIHDAEFKTSLFFTLLCCYEVQRKYVCVYIEQELSE